MSVKNITCQMDTFEESVFIMDDYNNHRNITNKNDIEINDEDNDGMPWMIFLFFMIPYIVTLIFALPRTNIGSKTYIISIIHRWSGINTLLIPLALMLYQTIYQKHPHIFFYIFGVLCIIINCIYGGLLIPKRIHAFDIPTIRAFVVGVTLGLSFVCLSLNFKFGHLPQFEFYGKIFAMISLIGLLYAINDSM